jgi:DivIVA domain-containing protein
MPLTPEDVQNKRFRTVKGPFKEGYDEEEVDAFLDEIEAELRRLIAENDSLRAQPPVAAPAAAAAPVAAAPRAEEPNEAALRTLLLAQRTADDAIAEAKAEAEQLVAQAKVRASSIESEAQQQHAAAMAELQRQRAALDAQIEELRTFEREYRTRLKAYLEGQLRELDSRAVAPAAAGAAPRATAPAAPPPATGAAPPRPVTPAPAGPPGGGVPGLAPQPPTAGGPPAAPPPPAAPAPPATPAAPASPFTTAPRLVEDMDAGSDNPLGPPREADGPGSDVDTGDERR